MKNMKKYLILWASQSLSQFGGSMTSFALTLWAYSQTHSALDMSLMSFCNYVPFILVSLFAGSFVDRHSKKAVMLIADLIAALGTLSIIVTALLGTLQIWQIYLINFTVGCTNAFQIPASAVAVGRLVPEDKISRVSGLNSFSSNLTTILAPVLAAFLYGAFGLWFVLAVDLITFCVAFFTLLIGIQIPEAPATEKREGSFAGAAEGMAFLRKNPGLLWIMVTMALVNFCSRLTYENVLSPMILARSGENNLVLSFVNGAMGIGGVLGGVLVTLQKTPKKPARQIYLSAGLSFLLGDILMALGRNGFVWALAGIAACMPVSFLSAADNVILYSRVPKEMQGRVFAVRNAVQCSTIPVAILLGGTLADYVMEPFMAGGSELAAFLGTLLGTGTGSGMALMFLCSGILGATVSLLSYRNKHIRALDQIPGHTEK